jgi:hypothetical protein
MATPLADGTSVPIGTHTLARKGLLLKFTLRGPINLEQTNAQLAHYQAILEEQGFVLVVLDVTKGGRMAMPARKASAEWAKTYGHRSRTAVVGAPVMIRTAIDLINRAANVLAKRKVPLGFFATEEEARRWLIAQIPILQQSTV